MNLKRSAAATGFIDAEIRKLIDRKLITAEEAAFSLVSVAVRFAAEAMGPEQAADVLRLAAGELTRDG